MIWLREDQQVRGELVAMIIALLPAPCRSEFAREKRQSAAIPQKRCVSVNDLRERARSYR